MANPIGAAVGAIALAATAIYKNWDGITNFFKGIFESLTDLMPDWLQNLMFGDDAEVSTPSVKPIQYSEPLGKIVNSGAPEQRVGGELTVGCSVQWYRNGMEDFERNLIFWTVELCHFRVADMVLGYVHVLQTHHPTPYQPRGSGTTPLSTKSNFSQNPPVARLKGLKPSILRTFHHIF